MNLTIRRPLINRFCTFGFLLVVTLALGLHGHSSGLSPILPRGLEQIEASVLGSGITPQIALILLVIIVLVLLID